MEITTAVVLCVAMICITLIIAAVLASRKPVKGSEEIIVVDEAKIRKSYDDAVDRPMF